MDNYVAVNFERKLNKELIAQECDARMLIRELMPETKKLIINNYSEPRNYFLIFA